MNQPKDTPIGKKLMPVEECPCINPTHGNYNTICNLCNNTGWRVKDPDEDED